MTAENSGLKCVAVTWGFRDREELILRGSEKRYRRTGQACFFADKRPYSVSSHLKTRYLFACSRQNRRKAVLLRLFPLEFSAGMRF